MGKLLAVDIGGTFTDLIAFDENTGELFHAKSSTTPNNLVQGIIDCINKSSVDFQSIRNIVHGSTIAINTVIEEKGARTSLITTRGMRDVYRIGRGNRPESYNLFFKRPRPLVPRHLTFEVTERMTSSGEALVLVNVEEVLQLCEELKQQKIDSVAVCLLHSYANPKHEKLIGEILRNALPDCYISLSHEILREYREYERTSTTVINSFIGPKVSRYIDDLSTNLKTLDFQGTLSIMQSNGGIMSPQIAMSKPVSMMESGPVGAIIASAQIGKTLGFTNIISFDMGGTTAKASLIYNNEPNMAEMYYVGGYASGHPVMSPVVDVVEVGTGGGSIAWIDEVNALKVGPQSAGADPAPISYGRGGTQPTITDAQVVLGRIGAEDFLGGEMPLDREGAFKGIKDQVADRMGMNTLKAAEAIIQIAIAKMSLAVREVSVEKGYDPRDFSLFASGGAGPLHAVAIAKELYIPIVVIPRFPAHFSAVGMLLTDNKHDFVQTYLRQLSEVDFAYLQSIYNEMLGNASQIMKSESISEQDRIYQILLDIRYVGQEFTLSVPVNEQQLIHGDIIAIRESFDNIHEQRFGHKARNESVEMVNIRLKVIGKLPKPYLSKAVYAKREVVPSWRKVYFEDMDQPVECPVYNREELPAGFEISGPALIQEYASTTVMFADDLCKVADTGELIISVGGIKYE